jgi:chromosome segregation ATPase
MPSISEIDRARMITSLAGAIGPEEANVLATALNLDGQLATRDELRVMEMALRTDVAEARQDLSRRIDQNTQQIQADIKQAVGTLRSELKAESGSEFALIHAEFGSVRAEFASVHAEFASVHAELASVHGELAAIRTDLASVHAEFASVHAEFASVHTESRSIRSETAADIAALRNSLELFQVETRSEFALVRSELRGEMVSMADGLKDGFSRDMQRQTRQLFVGMIGILVTLVGFVSGVLGLTGKL